MARKFSSQSSESSTRWRDFQDKFRLVVRSLRCQCFKHVIAMLYLHQEKAGLFMTKCGYLPEEIKVIRRRLVVGFYVCFLCPTIRLFIIFQVRHVIGWINITQQHASAPGYLLGNHSRSIQNMVNVVHLTREWNPGPVNRESSTLPLDPWANSIKVFDLESQCLPLARVYVNKVFQYSRVCTLFVPKKQCEASQEMFQNILAISLIAHEIIKICHFHKKTLALPGACVIKLIIYQITI